MQTATSRDRAILIAILLLALVLRVVGLNGPLWFDEIVTVETHLRLGWGEMLQSYSMNHHYLHNLAAKAAMTVFGESSWAIRLPSMLFGLGGIGAIWALARQVGGLRLAHSSALLLALSYHHIWFSQNARGYTGLALFSTLGLIFFLRGMKDQRRGTWLAFAACLAATIFTHLTGAFFFVTLGLVWLGAMGAQASRGTFTRASFVWPFVGFLVGGLVTLALYAPVIPSLLSEISGVAKTSAIDPMQEYQNPIWTIYEGLRTGLGQAGMLNAAVGLLVLTLSLAGAFALRHAAPLLAIITFGHVVLTVLVLSAVGMRIWPRFFFTDIALLLILIVAGVDWFCGLFARLTGPSIGKALFPLALTMMALLSATLALRNYQLPKQDLAGAVAQVEALRKPQERVYAISYSGEIFTGHFHTDWATIWSQDDYRAAMAQPGPLTIVVTFPDRNLREYPAIAADQTAGRLTESAFLPGTLGDGGILILRRD